MVINCPYCGERDGSEFVYHREGGVQRPDPVSTDQDTWNAYVYERANVAGDRLELWQHAGGCRALLQIVRNTLTHKISSVQFANRRLIPARPAASSPKGKS